MVNASAREIFEVLKLITTAPKPLGAREISFELSIQISKVHRAIRTLLLDGYIERSQSAATYVTGNAVRQLRRAFFSRFPIRQTCLPHMQLLAFITGETISLRVPIGWYSVLIGSVSGTNEIIQSQALGDAKPLHQSASALAILAFLPKEARMRYLDWMKRKEIPGSRRGIERGIEETRMRGYAIEPAPYAPDRAIVAFPILLDRRGIASIGIEGPVLDLHDLQSPLIGRCKEIVGRVNDYVAKHPDQFLDRHSELDPDLVEFGSAARVKDS